MNNISEICKNEEHREALQQDWNNRLEREFDKEDLSTIGKALEILSKRGIQTVLFAKVATATGKGRRLVQFNNNQEFIKWEKGTLSKETRMRSCEDVHDLAEAFVNHIAPFASSQTPNYIDCFSFFKQVFVNALNWRYNGQAPPEYVKLKNSLDKSP